MNYTMYPEYHSFPSYAPSDADFSHVVSSAPCYQQPQESDPARSLVNFMAAASGNLEILLRKPRKSRRKVNLKKYIDRQLKRRLMKLKTMGKAPHELSSITMHTVLAADDDGSKSMGWIIDEEDIDNDENEEDNPDFSGPSRSTSRCLRRQQARSSSQTKSRGGWSVASFRSQSRGVHQSHHVVDHPHAHKLPQELQEHELTESFEQDIFELLDEIGEDISENSDSGCLSEGSLYSHLHDSPVIEAPTATGYSSNQLPPNSVVCHSMMLGQGGMMQNQMGVDYCHQPPPPPEQMMMMHIHPPTLWQRYYGPPLPQVATSSQDLPLQLDDIPTEQLLATATATAPPVAAYY